jgi:release factor glutamine methyltransferase
LRSTIRITVKGALDEGAQLLERAAVGAPRLTAEVLLCHALGKPKSYLYSHPEEALTELAWIHYGRYLHERLKGKPTQYITGWQEFYGRAFRVNPAVLIPRPETEHVIEVALERAGGARRALDIGTGSGAIAVTWQLETGAETFGTDLSVAALEVATRNGAALGAQVGWAAMDLAGGFREATFDVVLANPPYIPESEGPHLQVEVREWEPRLALFGGPTGVEIYGRLIAEAERILKPGGWLVMEIGYQAQERVERLLGGWREVECRADLAGWPRVMAARR